MESAIDIFRDLEQEAATALKRLQTGEAKTGVSALQRIKYKAEDAARHTETMKSKARSAV